MASPLEHLVRTLNEEALGQQVSLEGVFFDDDRENLRDCQQLSGYGFGPEEAGLWIYPRDLHVQGRDVNGLLRNIPSDYRRLPLGDERRASGKRDFEMRLKAALDGVGADVVVLDGLLVILDALIQPPSSYYRRIYNIHPGITREGSPWLRRGAHATLDALYGARGEKVVDWNTMEKVRVPVVSRTGASFHYVDSGIDSGEVVFDVLGTDIDPEDTILELRWKNFNNSLFPALIGGLERVVVGS